jgi:RNA polymerase sigma-70 factor (ECF subfamily)
MTRSKTIDLREAEDRDLITRARKGDSDSYSRLVARWERRVINYLVRLVSNREDALDVSQEVFLKVYQGLPRLHDPQRFVAWLFRIAHNEAISLLRRRRPEGRMPMERGTPARRSQLTPIELSMTVERALGRLTGEQREATLASLRPSHYSASDLGRRTTLSRSPLTCDPRPPTA